MKLFIILLFLLFSFDWIFAVDPIAIVTKKRGKVKYRINSDNKYISDTYTNMLVNINNEFRTRAKEFIKVVYLDDGSVVSIYPNSEIIFKGSIKPPIIYKKIQIIYGIVRINSMETISNKISFETATGDLSCSQCILWIMCDESNKEQFILESGKAEFYNSSNNTTLELMPDSTVISRKDVPFEVVLTAITDIKYLESLMLDLDEKLIQYNTKMKVQKDEELYTVVIKLKNAINEKKEIILTYKENKYFPID